MNNGRQGHLDNCARRTVSGVRWLTSNVRWLAPSVPRLASGVRWLASGVRWLTPSVRWLASGVRWLMSGVCWLASGVCWLTPSVRRTRKNVLSILFGAFIASLHLIKIYFTKPMKGEEIPSLLSLLNP